MTDDARVLRVRVTGRVQGVSFRAWTRAEAERLGLRGWVRNEDDGSVTALIAGPDAAISEMLTRFWKGPPGAFVSSVEADLAAGAEITPGFQITG